VREVLQAVAQCHAKGVVLRDVKPENFLFRSKAETAPLKMVDFGLAEYCKPGQILTER
jgi:calcium-dependent protein kinase